MRMLEKLQAMEQIWEALEDSEVAPPAWHGEVLEQRRRAVNERPENYASLEEVRQRGMR